MWPRGAAKSAKSAPGAHVARRKPMVMWRSGGRVVALADRCTHAPCRSRSEASWRGTLQCGYHGICFDAKGACVKIPGQGVPHSALPVRAAPEGNRAAGIGISQCTCSLPRQKRQRTIFGCMRETSRSTTPQQGDNFEQSFVSSSSLAREREVRDDRLYRFRRLVYIDRSRAL
jgi:phenylpropionate dioxygenase-like ring-hydroxylating dioxygenase large terminal subunit